MRFLKTIYILLILILNCQFALSQPTNWHHDSLKNFFRSPIDYPIALAGNFGELRHGHFHAGLDIRTGGVTGKSIYAVADGYVSRVEISLNGYGKVIHLTHSNGLKSVYAHLSHFSEKINSPVNVAQRQAKSYLIDIEFEPEKIPVSKGEIVGLSGNSGGSAGPHLHFEIRNAANDVALNPLTHGFSIPDTKSPILKTLAIYPLNGSSSVNGKSDNTLISLGNQRGDYTLSQTPTVYGKIGFGIETVDHQNTSYFNCGVYNIKLYKNDVLVYEHTLDSVAFEETRHIMCHMDYKENVLKNKKIQRSYLLDNNQLSIYDTVFNRGAFFFVEEGLHRLRYEISDVYNNTSTLSFTVNCKKTNAKPPTLTKPDTLISFTDSATITYPEVSVFFPLNALFEDLPFSLKEESRVGRCVTPRYHIGELTTPLNDYATVGIKIAHIPEALRDKAVIVSLDSKSQVLAVEGGETIGEFVYVDTRSLGPYTVFLDTVPPMLRPLNIYNGKNLRGQSNITFKASDNLSGIETIDAYIDDEWVVMEYEPKTNTLVHYMSKDLEKGPHRWRLTLIDSQDNQNSFECQFNY